MQFEEIFITYWSQTTLILLAISYFIKRIFDHKSKKIEINHSLYQQNRLKTVSEFFANYAKAELMWNQIAIFDILSNKIIPKEIDKIVFPILNELNTTLLELKIYFNTKDHIFFEELVKGIVSINGKVSELYFNHNKEMTETNKVNEFQFFRDDTLKKNSKIIDKLILIIRNTYKT